MVTTVTRPKAQGYRALIGDEWYRVVPSSVQKLNVYTRDSLAPRSDDRGSVEENVLDVGYAFSRSNLTGGEGLDYYPRQHGEDPEPRDKIRFWDSGDFIIERPDSGEPYGLKIARESELFWSPTADAVDMASCLGRIYVIEGENVHRFNDLDDTTPDDTDDLGVTLVQIDAALDTSAAVLDVNGDIWYKGAQTDTYLLVYDSSADGPMLPAKAVWLVKGRIIAYCNDTATASNGILLEIAPVITGTPATPTEGAHVFTTIDSFQGQVYDVIDAGHAIVAAFHDGSLRSYVPQTDTAGDVPVLTIRARTQVPIGETPYQLAWNLGTLMVFTVDTNRDHLRVYVGEVLDDRFDFVVGPLNLVRTWQGATYTIPAYTANPVATRDAIYFWVGEGAADHNLWRFDLVTQGLFRERADSLATAPTGTLIMDDGLVWIESGDLYREANTIKPFAWLITSNITLGLNTPINWTAFTLEAVELANSGARVELWRSGDPSSILDPDDPGWVLVQNLTDAINSGVEQTKVNITSNTLALQIRAYRSTDALTSPEVVRFAVRGMPRHRDWIAEVPINISDLIEVPGRMPMHIPHWGNRVYETLSAQQGSSTVLQLLDPPTVIRGVFDNILTPVEYMTDRGSQGRYAVAVFRGSRIADSTGATSATGVDGLGIATLGIATLGIGEAE